MSLTETELVPPLGGLPVTPRQGKKRRLRSSGATTAALLMVGVAILTVTLRPSAASSNGAELLLGPALPWHSRRWHRCSSSWWETSTSVSGTQ